MPHPHPAKQDWVPATTTHYIASIKLKAKKEVSMKHCIKYIIMEKSHRYIYLSDTFLDITAISTKDS